MLDLPASRDVSRDGRSTDDGSVSGPDWRDRDRDIDQRPAFRSAHGLEAFHAPAAPEGFQNSIQLVQPVVGKQKPNGLAPHFICGIAVQPLCAAVPGQDDALQILADDRVV